MPGLNNILGYLLIINKITRLSTYLLLSLL